MAGRPSGSFATAQAPAIVSVASGCCPSDAFNLRRRRRNPSIAASCQSERLTPRLFQLFPSPGSGNASGGEDLATASFAFVLFIVAGLKLLLAAGLLEGEMCFVRQRRLWGGKASIEAVDA